MARSPSSKWANGPGSDSESSSPARLSRTPSSARGHRLSRSPSRSSTRHSASPPSRHSDHLNPKEEVIGAEILVKMEPGKAPKLSRTSSQKVLAKPPPSFMGEPDKYDEATANFQVIPDCIYSNKHIGSTEPALECDCAEEWDGSTQTNRACGEDSDCINRATKMECMAADCSCKNDCLNQRFQRREYAAVTVFKTEKKGYGLRADVDLRPNDFIFEYIGEVINEPNFRRRMRQYDDEGIKHFYFMSLNKGEFIDATKKGNLGRFCNHSCNPNCYVDKWVVGDKLRMGIFAERHVKAGEELVFNYNVDRYGADPQPCYCGEPNCTGFIGGKTQTERGTKLSNATIEALGIDDYSDWEFAVAKKPRKPRKTGENDEEYVNDVQPKSLEEDGVTKVMAALMQCKEKWIAAKLLGRIQRATDDGVMNRVVRMHGYRILKTALINFPDDANVILQVLDILLKLPRITKNKIADSGIEEVVEKLKDNEEQQVVKLATEILDIWSKLTLGYRIPRFEGDTPTIARADRPERRDPERRDPRPRSASPVAPKGPRSMAPQRIAPASNGPRPPYRKKLFKDLPAGWYSHTTPNGRLYFYSVTGLRQVTRPTEPAIDVAPPPPKDLVSHQQKLQQIIDNATKNSTPKDKSPAVSTPQTVQEEAKEEKPAGWRSYSEEKQKRLYENTLHPHIKRVLDKYRDKLPRDDLKRFGKEACLVPRVAKKLVNSDFKNGRVEDPTKISSKGERAVMKYAKEFFDKAVVKHREHERRRRDKARASAPSGSKEPSAARSSSAAATAAADAASTPLSSASDVEPSAASSPSGSERKRKREEEDEDDARAESLEREVRAASVGAKRARTVEGAPAAVDVPAPVGEEQEDDEERRLPPTPPSLPDAADPREDARERAEDGRGVGAGRPLPMVVDSLRGGAP